MRRVKNGRETGLMKLCLPLYIVFCLFAIIWLKAAVVNLEYELGELDKKRADLIRERKMVVAQRASFYSTEKIEKAAVTSLGMTLPVRGNVFYVKRTQAAVPVKASMK
ncbi:MAG: cell division protein FtsL [Nitrospirae bacterium]|nr:cell division protein FtsL [Nitrospirota bacterium]